jgi:ABC-type phosphate transport system substrate-binding protein
MRLPFLAIAVAAVLMSPAARAEVVVIVGPASPVVKLSATEVADVFLGRMTKLSDGRRPVPVDLTEGSPVRMELYGTILNMTPVQVKAYWSKLIFTGRGRPPRAASDAEAVLRAVRADPAAIGYVDRSAANASVRIVHP